MPRAKEFDRDVALGRAMHVFWERGFDGTSTEQLLAAMDVGRQSLYDTFGDKWKLYLAALQRYQAESLAALYARLHAAGSPLAGLRAMLRAFGSESPTQRRKGCLACSAIAEMEPGDPEVSAIVATGAQAFETALAGVVERGQAAGELDRRLDPRGVARYLLMTSQGLRLASKGGASAQALHDMAELALAGLLAR